MKKSTYEIKTVMRRYSDETIVGNPYITVQFDTEKEAWEWWSEHLIEELNGWKIENPKKEYLSCEVYEIDSDGLYRTINVHENKQPIAWGIFTQAIDKEGNALNALVEEDEFWDKETALEYFISDYTDHDIVYSLNRCRGKRFTRVCVIGLATDNTQVECVRDVIVR